MTMIRTAGMLGLSALLIGCSLPFKSTSSADLTQAGRYREAAELNLADARRSERQQFWSSAVSYYVMAADNYRQSDLPDRELSALMDGRRAALRAWSQTEGAMDRSPREGGAVARIEGRLAEYWLARDKSKASEHYRALLAHQDDVRMLYSAPGLELVKAASRSEALRSPNLTMRLYLFGLAGQYVEDGDLYPQLAIDFARRHGYAGAAGQLRQRLASVKQIQAEPDLRSRGDDPRQQMRAVAARSERYAQLGEATLAAVYADQQARHARFIAGRQTAKRSAAVDRGLDRLASQLAGVGKAPVAAPPAPPTASQPGAEPVNSCIQIASGGPNTLTLINNCSHNVSVAWCYIPAPGALQSERLPIQGNQICIHNGSDFPQVVLGRSGAGADPSKSYHSWELPYSQNTIYHIACNAGTDGKALPRVSGFDDNLQGSCPALSN
jgi:hypothetical protein